MIPTVVVAPRLLQANSLFHLTFTASQLIGLVVLGPLLAKVGGVDGLFVSMAAAIILCGALVWPLPSTRGEHDPATPDDRARRRSAASARDVQDIWQFVVRDRIVALSMVQWTIGAILGLVVATLVPGFAERLLHVNAEDAVFVMAPAGIGMVAGTAVLNRWGDRFEKHFLTNLGLFTVAMCMGVIGGLAFVVERVTARQSAADRAADARRGERAGAAGHGAWRWSRASASWRSWCPRRRSCRSARRSNCAGGCSRCS